MKSDHLYQTLGDGRRGLAEMSVTLRVYDGEGDALVSGAEALGTKMQWALLTTLVIPPTAKENKTAAVTATSDVDAPQWSLPGLPAKQLSCSSSSDQDDHIPCCVKIALNSHSNAVRILSLPCSVLVVTSTNPTPYCSSNADAYWGSITRSSSDLQARTIQGQRRSPNTPSCTMSTMPKPADETYEGGPLHEGTNPLAKRRNR